MSPPDAPLRGRRIVEVGGSMVGYAGRLLADLGAEVVKLELPGGDETRSSPLLFEFHNQNKRSVTVNWTAAGALDVLRRVGRTCDAVIVGSHSGRAVVGLSPGRLEWAGADTVVCAITPYGLTGPQRDWRATPFTSFAGSGQMFPVGPVAGPPVAMPGQQPFDIVGIRAAYLVQAALLSGRDDGGPRWIDLSVHETITWQRLVIEQFSRSGRIPNRESYFSPPPGGVWQCRDGQVDIAAHAPRHWKIFVDVLGRPDDLADELYEDRSMRVQLYDLVAELIAPHLAAVSAADFVERAQRAGLPCALSFAPGEIASDKQMVDREYFQRRDSLVLPGYPFRSTPPLQAGRTPAPAAGSDTGAVLAERRRPPSRPPTPVSGPVPPLSGLRVLSLGTFVAGNVCASILADLGADVVKIETPRRPEPLRSYYSPDHGEIHEPSGIRTTNIFSGLTTGLRSAAIDLTTDVGRELLRELAGQADILIENFGPGQMQRWDCGFDALALVQPRLVMISMSGYGQTGPRSHYRAYASNIANYLGLTRAWVHDGMHFDFVAAYHGVVAALAGVESVRSGGPGVHVDLAQAEAGAALMAPLYLDYVNGFALWSHGPNEVPNAVLSAVFACAGSDRWVAVELQHTADVHAARQLLELSEDADVGESLSSWCAKRTAHQAAWQLQHAGIAASVVASLEDLWLDPVLRSRGAYREIHHPDLGPQELPVSPDQVALGLPPSRRPSPRLGEHTDEVLQAWLAKPLTASTPERRTTLTIGGG